jgi:hypothetical protein
MGEPKPVLNGRAALKVLPHDRRAIGSVIFEKSHGHENELAGVRADELKKIVKL